MGTKALTEWVFREEYGVCERYDLEKDSEIDKDGNGDWKVAPNTTEKACKKHCREDISCTAIEFNEKD